MIVAGGVIYESLSLLILTIFGLLLTEIFMFPLPNISSTSYGPEY